MGGVLILVRRVCHLNPRRSRLCGPLYAGLLELARASRASLFMVLQAGLSALLTRGRGSGYGG
jgi:hypothetical protein